MHLPLFKVFSRSDQSNLFKLVAMREREKKHWLDWRADLSWRPKAYVTHEINIFLVLITLRYYNINCFDFTQIYHNLHICGLKMSFYSNIANKKAIFFCVWQRFELNLGKISRPRELLVIFDHLCSEQNS